MRIITSLANFLEQNIFTLLCNIAVVSIRYPAPEMLPVGFFVFMLGRQLNRNFGILFPS
jgi:hypothetical protein